MNKNIAFRLMHKLERLGFIYEDQVNGGYRLTYKLLNMARTQWLNSDVLSQALPVLRALAADSGELIRLAIVERNAYALNYEERDLGVVAIAAPILLATPGAQPCCVGVVSISTPSSRLPRSEVDGMARALLLPATKKLSALWPRDA